MQDDRQQQVYLLPVYNTIIYDNCKPDMEKHREQTLHDIHRHHGEIKRGSGLHSRQRSGSIFFRDLQCAERALYISRREQYGDRQIADDRWQNDRQDLDAAVPDPV